MRQLHGGDRFPDALYNLRRSVRIAVRGTVRLLALAYSVC